MGIEYTVRVTVPDWRPERYHKFTRDRLLELVGETARYSAATTVALEMEVVE